MPQDKNKEVHPWHPIEDIRSIAENMSRAYRPGVFDGARAARLGPRAPEQKLSLIENRSGFVLTVELPQVAKKDLHVNVSEDAITIFAHWTIESKPKEDGAEGRLDQFYTRTIKLPAPVKAEDARASFRDRVLKITLPRIAPSKVRRIDVE